MILANKRIIKAKGFVKIPNNSTTGINGTGHFNHVGTSGQRISFQYALLPHTLFGIFTKPFALMIRLFANIMAGHSVILALTSLIFVTVGMGPAINGTMTVVSVLFCIFMNFVELLVAFIQAYVFTMLSAVFIGLSCVEETEKEKA